MNTRGHHSPRVWLAQQRPRAGSRDGNIKIREKPTSDPITVRTAGDCKMLPDAGPLRAHTSEPPGQSVIRCLRARRAANLGRWVCIWIKLRCVSSAVRITKNRKDDATEHVHSTSLYRTSSPIQTPACTVPHHTVRAPWRTAPSAHPADEGSEPQTCQGTSAA